MSRSNPEMERNINEKLKELVLYVSEKCENDQRFGMVKLNKIILRADRLSYLRYGNSVSNAEYMRLPQGFVPKYMARHLDDLRANNEIVVKEKRVYDRTHKRVIPLREASLDCFSAKDIAIVDEIIQECKDLNARTLSEQSHGTAWKIASHKEVIPYTAFLLSDDQKLSESDIKEGLQLINQHGWGEYATT